MRGVLVDTSVWVEHFRRPNRALAELLLVGEAFSHPLVLGEIACGTPPNRVQTLIDLGDLPQVQQATVRETIALIDRHSLFGRGVGLVDLQLLASALITPNVTLWTIDKKFHALAVAFGKQARI
jgi:predicted nucleic acid-binding protein